MDMEYFSKLLKIRPFKNGAVFNKYCIDLGNELYINALNISYISQELMNDLSWNNFALLTRSKMYKRGNVNGKNNRSNERSQKIFRKE